MRLQRDASKRRAPEACRSVRKIMKHIILLFTVLILTACSSQQARPVVRPHIEQDTLAYLANHASLIAIIDITNSIDTQPGIQILTHHDTPTVTAMVTTTIKGDISGGSSITVSRAPAFTAPPATASSLYLDNGQYVAFLKDSNNNKYTPLTDASVMKIESNGLTPIWHRLKDTDEVRTSTISLDQVINEIEDVLSKGKDTEPAPPAGRGEAPRP